MFRSLYITVRLGWIPLLALFLIAPASAQDARKKFRVTIPYDGPEIFARLLDHAGLTPIDSLDRLGDAPADQTLIIVFGDPESLVGLDARINLAKGTGLGGFIRRGGALLIATDRTFSFERVPSLGWNDVRTTDGDFVNYLQNFDNQDQCPTITRKEFRRPEHPLFADIQQPIATNCPGCITMDNEKLQTLALLPLGTMPGRLKTLAATIAAENAPLPRRYIIAPVDKNERALLIAGHGLFTNCMTVREDIDNRRLALNAINWLKGNARTRVLFINEGKIVSNFKMPLAGPPKLPAPTIELVNRIIDAVQNSNLIERVFDRVNGPANAIRGAIIFGTFALLLYGAKKYFQSSGSLKATVALLGVPSPEQLPLVKRRLSEMATRNQYGESAQALARDWFRTYAQVEFPAGQIPAELTFDLSGGVFKRRKRAAHLKSLWKLATQPPPADWDSKKFRSLAIFLEELSLSTAGGEVVFKPQRRS